MAGEWLQRSASARAKAVQVDVRRAHSARVYDYWLGGKDNFASDRDAAEEAIGANPGIVGDARANRAFLARAVSVLARDHGVMPIFAAIRLTPLPQECVRYAV